MEPIELDKLVSHLVSVSWPIPSEYVGNILYIADIRYRQFTGKPISGLVYFMKDGEPFAAEINESLERIKNFPVSVFKLNITAGQRGVINVVVSQLLSAKMGSRLDIKAFLQKEINSIQVEVEPDGRLKMEMVDNERKVRGFDIEKVWESVESQITKPLKTHDEVFRKLKN